MQEFTDRMTKRSYKAESFLETGVMIGATMICLLFTSRTDYQLQLKF